MTDKTNKSAEEILRDNGITFGLANSYEQCKSSVKDALQQTEALKQQLGERDSEIEKLREGIKKRVDVLTEEGNISNLKGFYDSIQSLLSPTKEK